MIFGDGDGSGKNNGTYFEISFRSIAIEMYPFKITEKYKIKPKNRDIHWLRNDETIISSISVTDIFFDVYLGKWNYRAIPKVKTWSYFLTIPKD